MSLFCQLSENNSKLVLHYQKYNEENENWKWCSQSSNFTVRNKRPARSVQLILLDAISNTHSHSVVLISPSDNNPCARYIVGILIDSFKSLVRTEQQQLQSHLVTPLPLSSFFIFKDPLIFTERSFYGDVNCNRSIITLIDYHNSSRAR